MTNIHWLELLVLIGVLLAIVIGILVFVLTRKNEQLSRSNNSLIKLTRSFHELDEQAKLIVRTDLELNKTQDELDKRMMGLETLQKISRLISTTLDEEEIFHRINQPLFIDLGFEKSLILLSETRDGSFVARVTFGFTEEEITSLINQLKKEENLLQALKEGHAFSSVITPKQRKEQILKIFRVEHFILTPILAKDGMIGLVFVGNRTDSSVVTSGDEELISILANQIGQAIENARLFEEVYRSSQMLESKVQERTKQLALALEEVQKISKTKSEFISAVSHELRTPLTSIKGYASILMSEKLGAIPGQVKERLDKINKHSDNLVKMINDLLDISRIESGKTEIYFAKHHLKSIIDNVHDLLTPQLREKNLQWTVHIDPTTPEVMVDKSLIERVFINLVSNAIKFTPPQGSISVMAKPHEDLVLIEVNDTGIGIAEEHLPKLFNEFYRVDNEINQSVKGTGLGLSLVKNIVEAHGGKIWATSEVHKGTTLHFQLPIQGIKIAKGLKDA